MKSGLGLGVSVKEHLVRVRVRGCGWGQGWGWGWGKGLGYSCRGLHRLAVRLGQRESDLPSDAHGLGVPDHVLP